MSIGKDIKCKKTKSCYKHLKWNIDYPFIQADAKMSYLTIRSIRNLVGLNIDFPKWTQKEKHPFWLGCFFWESIRNFGSARYLGDPGFGYVGCSIYNYSLISEKRFNCFTKQFVIGDISIIKIIKIQGQIDQEP